VCDNCGKHDQVPFHPKVGRSVLCRECHAASQSRTHRA
jgi:CxxC-x17-CxxC domain-containing protein